MKITELNFSHHQNKQIKLSCGIIGELIFVQQHTPYIMMREKSNSISLKDVGALLKEHNDKDGYIEIIK